MLNPRFWQRSVCTGEPRSTRIPTAFSILEVLVTPDKCLQAHQCHCSAHQDNLLLHLVVEHILGPAPLQASSSSSISHG